MVLSVQQWGGGSLGKKVQPQESLRLWHKCSWHSSTEPGSEPWSHSHHTVKETLLLVCLLQSDTALIPAATQEQPTVCVPGWASLWKALEWRGRWSCSSSSHPWLPLFVRSAPSCYTEACSKSTWLERFSVCSEQIPTWYDFYHLTPNWALWLLQKQQTTTEFFYYVYGYPFHTTEFKIKFSLTL